MPVDVQQDDSRLSVYFPSLEHCGSKCTKRVQWGILDYNL